MRELPSNPKFIKFQFLAKHSAVTQKVKSAKAAELFRCYVCCERDPACKSWNFKHAQEICEFNNTTKETKPNLFITDEQSYYMKRESGGGYKVS